MPRPGTAHQRGYGHAHRKRRAELLRLMVDGDPCARCGQAMYRSQRLDADHVDTPRALGGALPDALSHASCNQSHGATLGNQMRAHGLTPTYRTRPSRRLAPPTSRTW